MRWLMAVGMSLTVLVGSGWADEIYRWTDAAGAVHFSNTPTTGGAPTGLSNDEAPAADTAAAPGTPSSEQVADAQLHRLGRVLVERLVAFGRGGAGHRRGRGGQGGQADAQGAAGDGLAHDLFRFPHDGTDRRTDGGGVARRR